MSIPIISFYSYKGGSGRTTTTVNAVSAIAKQLGASKDRPLLVVDFDIESAGLTYFFNLQSKFYTGTHDYPLTSVNVTKILEKRGYLKMDPIISLIFEPEATDIGPIDDKIINSINEIATKFNLNVDVLSSVEITNDQSRLLRELTSAYNNDNVEFQRNRKFNFRNFIEEVYRNKGNLAVVEKVIDEYLPLTTFADISSHYDMEPGSIKLLGVDDNISVSVNAQEAVLSIGHLQELCEEYNFCGLVCDSSSGRQSTADVLHRVSNVIVYCMRPTSQFRIGTSNNLSFYRESISKSYSGRIPLRTKIIVLPTAVPIEKSEFTESIFLEINDVIIKGYKSFVDGHFCSHEKALCEVNRFKWKESILKIDGNIKPDELRAYKTYEELGEKIVSLLKESVEQ